MKNWIKEAGVALGLALVFGGGFLALQSCGQKARASSDERDKAGNVQRIGVYEKSKVYEIEFDGAKYIVVETYRGIGVCQKAGEIVWTKEVE
jgi:hypothetical protein